MPSVLKKSPSGVSFSRGTLKCAAARLKISSRVLSVVGIGSVSKSHNYEITKSRQIRLHAFILHKLPQPLLHRRLRKQLAKNLNLPLQLLIRNRLHKLLGRNRRSPIKFPDLCGSSPRQSQRLALRRNLTDQPDLLRLHNIETASRHQ